MKTETRLVEGTDYELLPNNCIKIARDFDDVVEEYVKQSIPDYLSLVDHDLALEDDEYKKLLEKEEERLNMNVRQLKDLHKALIVVFQGRDGAGKSGATERIIEAVDYDMEIFDAVHIGSPLKKSYAEIRAFEWLHSSCGYILVKFWLDITKGEQDRRFKKRAKKKPWKLSPSDGEARKAWDHYTDAANEMFHRTATSFAPWFLVSSENKNYSRVTVLQVINHVLKENL